METLDRIKTALLNVTSNVAHYHQLNACLPYLVWAEEGGIGDLWADNRHTSSMVRGTVNYFTLDEKDGGKERTEEALSSVGASWFLNSVQYEQDTGIIHFEWVWELA